MYNAPFFGGQSKVVAKKSLTRNCLCQRHNSLLSIYDDEAINFGMALKYCHDRSFKYGDSAKKRQSIHTKHIDTDWFYRWYLKTYLGISDFFSYDSALDKDVLAALVFSGKKINDYLDLKISMSIKEDFQVKEVISVAPLESQEQIVGMQVELYGIRLHGLFFDQPKCKQKPIRIKFRDRNKNLLSVIKFS
ncbi:hypothetical protein [Microbulbifer sp. JMSA008]|uniref:hypothetical protein n=1 Tax=Microbulbifer sp. JMSA008 TaxID=3243373 RepID=UPI004039A500